MAKLIIRYPDNIINEVEFDQPRYKVGHAQDNDLVLDNDEVAPNQAEIETADGAYSIADVSGNNSTAVNGKKIERVNLNYGDRISFGPVIGLFYPSKKRGVGDRTKLFLYVGTGALIIFLSIFLIFYFTIRGISPEVAQPIGEVVTPDEPARDTEKREVKREKSEEPVIGAEEEAAIELETRERRFSFKGLLKREKLILPELGGEIIAGRDAVAIPRGLWRLFFRKTPVHVQVEVPLKAGEEVTLYQEEITFEEETPSVETAPFEEEFVPPEEELAFPETGEEPEVFEEFEEEELQEKGFITRIFSPVINIFTRNKEEELTFEEEIGEE
ncbi:MAG: FHA domain-containing protein, partial [Spirochaetes bacterium]|nr:FHA domain-containing protein [Spirochaetota bacterium]